MNAESLIDLAKRLHGEPVPGVRMKEAEFAAWCPHDIKAEWVDGDVILMAPANYGHIVLNGWLITLLTSFVAETGAGEILFDFWVRLSRNRRRRVPDLMFVSHGRTHLIEETVLNGAPDLIVEIISPDSQSRDRRTKFLEYQSAGVKEYWLLDPISKTLEVYALVRRKYEPVQEINGVVESKVLRGLKLKTSTLWQTPLPKVSVLLRQLTSRG